MFKFLIVPLIAASCIIAGCGQTSDTEKERQALEAERKALEAERKQLEEERQREANNPAGFLLKEAKRWTDFGFQKAKGE